MGASIGGLGNWFKKRADDAQGAYHQINMFDGGRTFDTNNRQAMPYTPPPTVRNRNVFQKGFDQANFLDNGRSWQTSMPDPEQARRSLWQQAAPIGQGIVKAPAQMLNTIAAQVPQVYYTGAGAVADLTNNDQALNNAIRMQEIANNQFGDKGGLFNVGTFYNADDARRGDLKTGIQKIGGGTLMTAATVVPMARGGSIAGRAFLPTASKGAGMGARAAALGGRAAMLGGEGAAYSGAYSVGQQYHDNGQVNAGQLARDTAFGFAGGAALPIAGAGARAGARGTVRIAQKGAEMAPVVAQKTGQAIKVGAQNLDDALMGTSRPFRNISDGEFSAAQNARRAMTGWGDVADDMDYQALRSVQQKLGVDLNDFDAVDNALGDLRTWQSRKQAAQAGFVKIPGKGGNADDLARQRGQLADKWADATPAQRASIENKINQLDAQIAKMEGNPADEIIAKDKIAISKLDKEMAKSDQLMAELDGSTMPAPTIKVPGKGKQPLQTNQPLGVDNVPQGAPFAVKVGKKTKLQQEFPSTLRTRGFIDTVFNDPNTSVQVKQALIDLDATYMTRNTKQLQIRAANFVKDHPAMAEQMAMNAHDDISVAVGGEILKVLQSGKNPNYTRAVEIANAQAKALTEAGRTAQAASIYGRLTPEGILRFTQQQIDQYNKATGKKIVLNPTDAQRLSEMAKAIQKLPEGPERVAATAKLVAEVQRTMPASLASKLATLQTMAQLLNPKTNIRNIGGNSIFGGLDSISQMLATPVDKAVGAVTGRRTTGLPNIKIQAKGIVTGGKTAVKEAYGGYSTGPKTQFDLNDVPAFRGKILGNLEKTMNATLRGADRAAYTAAFDDTLANLMKLNKVSKPTAEMLEQAHHQGLYRTFQDTNRVSNVFVGIKKGLNNIGIGNDTTGRFGLGDIILKYPKTPGNLLARGIDYSPLGMGKAIFEASAPLMGREFNQKAFVDAFSRSIVGSGSAFGIGYTLAQNGIITASPEKDKDLRNLQKTQGLGGYQINASGFKRWVQSGFNKDAAQLRPGDTLVSYDWAQPIAIPISAGAALGSDKPERAGKEAVNSLVDSTNTLAEQPLVQGVQRFFGNTQNNGGIGGAAQGAVEDIPASFVPTLLNQTNQLFDNKTRNMDGVTGVERATNQVKAKIPGLAQTLPTAKNVLGEDRERYQDGGNNPFNVLINPAFVSKYKGQPGAQEAIDLYKRTGETRQAPNTVPRKVTITGADGQPQDIKLTGEQQGQYQEYVGKFVNAEITKLTQDPSYKNLPDGDKINILSDIQSKANEAAKVELFGHNPKELSSGAAQILGRTGYDAGVGNANNKIEIEKFKQSGEKSKVIGDEFWYKKGNGEYASMPKVAYEVEQETAQINLGMDRAQGSNNIQQWMTLAEKKYNALEKKKSLYDPVTEADKVASITLEQENLKDKVEKYASYGGFKKGSGKFGGGTNLPNINVGISQDLFNPVISNASYAAPKLQLKGGRNIRVARAKSSIKIKAPKRLA